MDGIRASFKPIWKKLRKFKVELILLSLASLITLITLVLFLHDTSENNNANTISEEIDATARPLPVRTIVDIAGAIERPGVYEVSTGGRLKDVLIQAGGLSADAHKDYFSRNFNLAKLITDQEKIYVPSSLEINSGIFEESLKSIDYTAPNSSQGLIGNKININNASSDELDTLPGIGKITAEKILQNRPYSIIEELLTKKIINKNVYQQIKDSISN